MNQHQLIEIIGNKDVVTIIQDYMNGTPLKHKEFEKKNIRGALSLGKTMNIYGFNISEHYRKIFRLPGCEREPIYKVRFINTFAPTLEKQYQRLVDNGCLLNVFLDRSIDMVLLIKYSGFEHKIMDCVIEEDLSENYYIRTEDYCYNHGQVIGNGPDLS